MISRNDGILELKGSLALKQRCIVLQKIDKGLWRLARKETLLPGKLNVLINLNEIKNDGAGRR